MSDVPYQIGQRIAESLGWTYRTERSLVGGVKRVTWHPKPGSRIVKSGEFWPEVEAMPSRLTVSEGSSRVIMYIGGANVQNVRIDAVGVIPPYSTEIARALDKADVPVLYQAVEEKWQWTLENPEYTPIHPNQKPQAKSKLNPSQIEV
jgi:hypothetical protein